MPATVTRNPTADEAVSGTWSGTAGTRYTLVNDYADTAGTSILTHGTTTAGNITFSFSAFSLPTEATSISVAVLYYDRKNASQSCNIGGRLKVSGTYYNATTHNPTNGSIVQRTDTWATNPANSSAWTVTDINSNLQAFGWNSTDASPAIDLTSIQLQVTYTRDLTFTADRAQFTLTGNAVNLSSKRTADRGQFTLTGGAANLNRSYRMTADRGQFAVTGQSVNLNSKRTADRGQFALTGNAAGLSSKRTADRGQFALTGGAVTFKLGYSFPVATGAYGLSGGDAGLLRAYREPLDTVAFTFEGTAIGFKRDQVLPVDSGAFALTGHNVDLHVTYGLDINLDTGAFTFTGNAANLVADLGGHVLQAESGAFALSGSAVAETVHRRLWATSGGYLLTGEAIAATRSLVFPVGRSQFALTGSNAVLGRGYLLSLGSGSFAEDGFSAGLTVARWLYGSPAGFSVVASQAGFSRVLIAPASSLALTLTGRNAGLTANRRRKVIVFM